MLSAEKTQALTQLGPETPMDEYLRRYWRQIAGTSEFDDKTVCSIRLFGEDLVLFKDPGGCYGPDKEANPLASACPDELLNGMPRGEQARQTALGRYLRDFNGQPGQPEAVRLACEQALGRKTRARNASSYAAPGANTTRKPPRTLHAVAYSAKSRAGRPGRLAATRT